MQPPVFLADRAALESDVVVLSGAEGRHAAAVRRLRPGERADVADGAGLVAECVVAGPSRGGTGGLELTVQARRQVPYGFVIVGREQHRRSDGVESAEHVHEFARGINVQAGSRLVRDQQRRPVHHGARNAKSLLLAS